MKQKSIASICKPAVTLLAAAVIILLCRKGIIPVHTILLLTIAETALTSGWEAQLARMERGKLTQEEFMKGVLKLSREVTEDIFRKCER